MSTKPLTVRLQIELEDADQARRLISDLAQFASAVAIESDTCPEADSESLLTPTECKLLDALTRYDTIPEAAHELCISPCTARKYLENAYRKLEVHSLHRAIVVAVKRKVISL